MGCDIFSVSNSIVIVCEVLWKTRVQFQCSILCYFFKLGGVWTWTSYNVQLSVDAIRVTERILVTYLSLCDLYCNRICCVKNTVLKCSVYKLSFLSQKYVSIWTLGFREVPYIRNCTWTIVPYSINLWHCDRWVKRISVPFWKSYKAALFSRLYFRWKKQWYYYFDYWISRYLFINEVKQPYRTF